MTCNRIVLFGVATCLLSGVPANAGYWKFRSYSFDPAQSFYDQVRRGTQPPHVYEVRIGGAFWGSASAHGTVESFFKTDDADLKVSITQGHCNVALDNAAEHLFAGLKVHFRSDTSMTASGFPNASGSCAVWIDNGNYILTLNTAQNRPASGEADAVIPNGWPGGTMVVHIRFGTAQNGAVNTTLHGIYDWVP